MRLQDTLWLGIKGISERKFRTALTVLCVVIGVAAIVALVSLVAGSAASISKSLEAIGPTTIYIVPRASHIFTDADIAAISGLPNVSTVVPMVSSSVNATVGSEHVTATLIGINNESLGQVTGNLSLYSGSFFNQTSVSSAVVGYSVAFPNSTTGVNRLGIDQPVYLLLNTRGGGSRSITLVVNGIFNKYGSSSFVSPDTSIFIPLPDAENLLETYSYNQIVVKASNTTTVTPLYNLLETIYGNSATIISVQELASTVSSVVGSIGLLLGSIAGISLIVAGISILSIMMVSVTERTREIGILKAIGFRKSQVLILFLTEALVIGALGGIIGVIAGAGGSYLLPALLSGFGARPASSSSAVSASSARAGAGGFSGGAGAGAGGFSSSGRAGAAPSGAVVATSSASSSSSSSVSITPLVTPEIVIGSILLAIIVSVLSSLYPAWKASTVDPIRALRTE